MDRPASQYTLVSYLITLLPLLFVWSYTGFSGVTVHPADVVAALAAPATASGIARAARPVRASAALRENDMGTSIHIRAGACRRPQPRLRVCPAGRFSAPQQGVRELLTIASLNTRGQPGDDFLDGR